MGAVMGPGAGTRWGTQAARLALLCAALMHGCASADGALDRPDAGAVSDASVPDQGPLGDLGLPDQGPDGGAPQATLLPADPARFAPFLAASGAEFGPTTDAQPAPWASCYAPGSSGDAPACGSGPCALLATCCVADGGCAELQLDDALPPALLFSSCASGASALTCVPGQTLTALGSSTPTVEAGGLRPGGDGVAEGGVLVGDPLDLRAERVSLSVVFAPPLSCPNSACLESAGVSVAPASELALGVVNPLAGLFYSASRGDVSLLLGGQVRAAWPLNDPSASFTLELLPVGSLGSVRVYQDNVLISDEFTYAPREDTQVVLHGRNTELQGARVRSLHALRYRSEAPDTFGARSVVALPAPVDVSPWNPRGAAVTQHEGRTFVVVENDGALFRGELLSGGVSFDSALRVVVDMGLGEEALSAPALLVRPDGETLLVYAARLSDGTRAIRARRGLGGPLGPLPEVLAVADAGPGHSLDDPALLEHAQRLVLVVRHRQPDGSSALELWASAASSAPSLRSLTPWPASNLSALTQLSSQEAAQTQARAPHLSVRGGTFRVHYERQVGTRSVIQLLVSDELRAFRALGDVLGPRPGQVDALGVGSPSAVQDASGVERLYTMGRDGVTERLLVSERRGVLDPASLRAP